MTKGCRHCLHVADRREEMTTTEGRSEGTASVGVVIASLAMPHFLVDEDFAMH